MSVIRWRLDIGGTHEYLFPRNPDRAGGDTNWARDIRMSELDVIGGNTPTLQVDGFKGARRTIRFTAITGTMMRTLRDFYFREQIIENCTDHLYPTTPLFDCFIVSFTCTIHPTIDGSSFPGSGEDTYDVEMVLVRMS